MERDPKPNPNRLVRVRRLRHPAIRIESDYKFRVGAQTMPGLTVFTDDELMAAGAFNIESSGTISSRPRDAWIERQLLQ
jgi:hypothetical protein